MKGFNLETSPWTPPSLPSTSSVPPSPSPSQMPIPAGVSASLAQTWSIESLLQDHTLHATNRTSDGRSRPGGTGNNHTITPTSQYPYPGPPVGVPPTAYTRRQGYFPPRPTVPILWPNVSPEWELYAPPPQIQLYPFYPPFGQSVPFTGAMLPSSYHNPFLPHASRAPTQLYNIPPPLPNIFIAGARPIPHLAKTSRYIPSEITINNLQGQKVGMKESKRSHAGSTILQPPTLARRLKPSKAERKRLKAIQREATRLQRVKDWLEKLNGAATDTDNEASEKAAANEKMNVPAADTATATALRAASMAARHTVPTILQPPTLTRWLKPSRAERKRLKAIQVEATRMQTAEDWLERLNGAATDTDNEASGVAAANAKMNVSAADTGTTMTVRAANMAARHAVTIAIRANTAARHAFVAAVDAAHAALAADAAAAAALTAAAAAATAPRDMKEQNSEIVTQSTDKVVDQPLEHAVEEMAVEQDRPRPELSDLRTGEGERSAT